jgi:hypothetical protein
MVVTIKSDLVSQDLDESTVGHTLHILTEKSRECKVSVNSCEREVCFVLRISVTTASFQKTALCSPSIRVCT